MSGISSGSFNFGMIGNVGLYAKQLVNSYTANAKAAASNNSYASVTAAAFKNNATFTKTNTSNLQSLKSAASSMSKAVTGLGSYTKDTDVVKSVQNFASSYNKAVSHLASGAADGAGVDKALGLIADNRLTAMSMKNYGTYAATRMEKMGISIDDDGMMQIDADKLKAAIKESPSSVKNALTGYGSITETTQKNADLALRIPAATYTDFSNVQVRDSLIDMLMPTSGFMFDFFA